MMPEAPVNEDGPSPGSIRDVRGTRKIAIRNAIPKTVRKENAPHCAFGRCVALSYFSEPSRSRGVESRVT
jgi:hypothetical protein